jgi:hypothetical protein
MSLPPHARVIVRQQQACCAWSTLTVCECQSFPRTWPRRRQRQRTCEKRQWPRRGRLAASGGWDSDGTGAERKKVRSASFSGPAASMLIRMHGDMYLDIHGHLAANTHVLCSRARLVAARSAQQSATSERKCQETQAQLYGQRAVPPQTHQCRKERAHPKGETVCSTITVDNAGPPSLDRSRGQIKGASEGVLHCRELANVAVRKRFSHDVTCWQPRSCAHMSAHA